MVSLPKKLDNARAISDHHLRLGNKQYSSEFGPLRTRNYPSLSFSTCGKCGFDVSLLAIR